MRRPRRRQPVAVALYLNAGLLAAILVALLARGGGFGLTSPAHANPLPNPPAIGVVGNLALMPAQFTPSSWGCYVLDADRRTLCAYQYLTGQNQLRMVAARHFAQDLDLKNWNTGPDMREIQRLVDLERNAVRGRGPQPQPQNDPPSGLNGGVPFGGPSTQPAEPANPNDNPPPEIVPADPGEIEPAAPGPPG